MAQVVVEIPDEVFGLPLDAPRVPFERWDGKGVPAGVVLRWIDLMPLSAWSVALLEAIDPAELDPADLPRHLAVWDRVEAHAAARKAAAVERLRVAGAPSGRGIVVDPVAHEVAAALRMPVGAAQQEVYRAKRLALLPVTRELAEDGQLTARHVAKMVAATGHLDAAGCAAVEAALLPGAAGLDVRAFTRAVRRAAAKVDPAGLDDRHREAAAHSDVHVEHDDDAMSFLAANLPTVDAVIIMSAVDHHALAAKHRGDPRPIGVLRVEALRVFAEAYLTGRITGTVPTHHGRPVEIQVCATPEALAGLTDTPGEIPGVGPVPIDTIREMARDAHLRWLTIDADTGRLLDRNPDRWRIPAALQAHADATYVLSVGPHSTVPAARCDGEHLVAHPEGKTVSDNIAPMDRRWHVAKTHAGFRVTPNPDRSLTWQTPLGQSVMVHPYDYRLGP